MISVALDTNNIVEEIEHSAWYDQCFNYDYFQEVKDNILIVYIDWNISTKNEQTVYLPFVHKCGTVNYNQAVYIKLKKE